MSSPNKDGGLAFPWPVPTFDSFGKEVGHSTEQPGMSQRALLAGMAMQAMIPRINDNDMATQTIEEVSAKIAVGACRFADALLKELEVKRA